MITAEEVIEVIPALFSSSKAGYNFPNANRVRSRAQLSAHIRKGDPAVAWISDYQGAGKSTLIDLVVNEFRFRTAGPMVRARDVTLDRLRDDYSRFRCVFVDDADIRTVWPSIQRGLATAYDFALGENCPVVICGDFVLRDDSLREIFGVLPQEDIRMEPVDRTFVLEALNERLKYLFPDRKDEFADSENRLFSDDLLDTLVPRSSIPVATFREVLSLAEGIAHNVEPTGDPFLLTREEAYAFCESQPLAGPTPAQWDFLRMWLLPYVTERFPFGRDMPAFHADEVLDALDLAGISDENALASDVLEPLCAGGLLHALGTPIMAGEVFQRYRGPYIPRPRFLLHAYAGI